MRVLDATVSVPAAEPLLGRHGVATAGLSRLWLSRRHSPPSSSLEQVQGRFAWRFLSEVFELPSARPSRVQLAVMQSQALATLVIIRQIVQPASDLAHTLPESSFSKIAAFIGIA